MNSEVTCEEYECTGLAVQYYESDSINGTLLLNVQGFPSVVVNNNDLLEMTVFPIYKVQQHRMPQFEKMTGDMNVTICERFVGKLGTLRDRIRTVDVASKLVKLGSCLARWKVTFKEEPYRPVVHSVCILKFAPFVSPNLCIPAVDPAIFEADPGFLESLGLKAGGQDIEAPPPMVIDTMHWSLNESISHYACIAAEKYAHYNAPKLVITEDGDVEDFRQKQKLKSRMVIP